MQSDWLVYGFVCATLEKWQPEHKERHFKSQKPNTKYKYLHPVTARCNLLTEPTDKTDISLLMCFDWNIKKEAILIYEWHMT